MESTKTKVPAICLSVARRGAVVLLLCSSSQRGGVLVCKEKHQGTKVSATQSELHTKQDKHNNVSALVLCVCVDLKCRLILE